MDSEEFWCLVGDRVQTWFLNHSTLTNERFKKICKKIREENE